MKVRLKPDIVGLRPFTRNKDKVKIEDHDLWNVDETLAKIIGPLIREYRNSDDLGTPGSLVGLYDSGGGHKEWLKILDHIAWSMDQIAEEKDFNNFTRETKPANTEGWKQICVFGPCFWVNQAEYDKYQAEIQKGIDLLAKHFKDLWS